MVHTFESDIAVKYGVNAAILLQNLRFWIEKNAANEKHFYDGYYWTYNSIKAFEGMFPYMSTRQIRTALDKLENEGIIISGNYNTSTYDRTKWYALTEVGYALFNNGNSICQNVQMDSSKTTNRFDSGDKPIPYINTDIYTDSNTDVYNAPSDSENLSEPASNPPAIEIILNDKSLYPVYQKDVEEWQDLYPGVDVMQELRKMKGWCKENVAKRKTRKGVRRFINSWLSREQDRGGRNTKPVKDSMEEWING